MNENELYGIRGVALNWITSYLANRSQFVSIEGSHSSLSHVSCGVPQGAVLGPKLFTLMMFTLIIYSMYLT